MNSMKKTWQTYQSAMAESRWAHSSANEAWDQHIRGVDTIEYTGSGKRYEVENTKVDEMLHALNESGSGRWRRVPASELILRSRP